MRRMLSPGLVLVLLLAGCAGMPKPSSEPPPGAAQPAGTTEYVAGNLGATAWMQTAQEYRAAVRGSFATATAQMERALADPGWDALPPAERADLPMAGLPAAVIVDADETMIDNSAYQGRNILDERAYTLESWQAWVAERKARALPGALDFAKRAEQLGVKIFYVTNRVHDPERPGTVDNLRALGFPLDADAGNVLLAGDPRAPGHDKGARRRWVGERYRVLLVLGDNLGDFVDGSRAGAAERDALMAPFERWWGERWFMLPNPSYGSWETAIRRDCAEGLSLNQCMKQALRRD